MPSSAVRTFSDPDDYAASIRGTSAEMTVMGRGHFRAKLIQVELYRLRMQRFSDNLPRIAHSAAVTGRAIVNFRIRTGPSMLANGVELKPTSIEMHTAQHQVSLGTHPQLFFAAHSQCRERHPDFRGQFGDVQSPIRVFLDHPAKPAHDQRVPALGRSVLAGLPFAEAPHKGLDQRLFEPCAAS